jgi:hypothetical protein
MASTGEIRTWLRENGFEPGERGRLNPDHLRAWAASHPGESVDKSVKPQAVKAPAVRVASEDEGTESQGVSGLSREEQETTINVSGADDLVRVSTTLKRHITQMRRDANYTEVRSGHYGTTEWAEFTCPVDKFRFGSKKVVNLSEEVRQERAERMRSLHQK